LRVTLRDWAENLLNETRLRNEGFFNPEPIRKKWLEHLSGQHNWQYHLWDVYSGPQNQDNRLRYTLS